MLKNEQPASFKVFSTKKIIIPIVIGIAVVGFLFYRSWNPAAFENFNWDDLVINTSQLTTEEWTPEKLIKLVQREQLKTKLSVYLSDKAGRIYLLKKIIDKLLSFTKTKPYIITHRYQKPNSIV